MYFREYAICPGYAFGAKPSPSGIITLRKILNLLNIAEFQKSETQASVF